MIYRPATGAMWDPSILFHDGSYYAFMMYNPHGSDGLAADRCLLATSPDGVHWRDDGVVVEELDRAQGAHFFKCFVSRMGERFVMNHGVARADRQDTLRFYESSDLRRWTHVTDTHPDPRWYVPTARWDHMYMRPKGEGSSGGNDGGGYWGYPVAVARAELPRGVGLAQSRGGLSWEALPPAEVRWGELPPNDFEWGGCERIADRYYLIGGTWGYRSSAGYSMYSFTAAAPTGPFQPDVEAFRLSGTSGRDVAWLAAWCRGDGELLVSNYASPELGSRSPYLLPLRKPFVDRDGHLRLGWWPGNERLKGDALPIARSDWSVERPAMPNRFRLEWLPEQFDVNEGVLLEGTIAAEGVARAHLPAAVGFAFSEGVDCSRLVLLGVGPAAGREAQVGRLEAPNGAAFAFSVDDVTGEGCATSTGFEEGGEHRFRLLARRGLFELYLDDVLVQTHHCRADGRAVGFVARNAAMRIRALRAWGMSLTSSWTRPAST